MKHACVFWVLGARFVAILSKCFLWASQGASAGASQDASDSFGASLWASQNASDGASTMFLMLFFLDVLDTHCFKQSASLDQHHAPNSPRGTQRFQHLQQNAPMAHPQAHPPTKQHGKQCAWSTRVHSQKCLQCSKHTPR